jgi:copper chaperone NosL
MFLIRQPQKINLHLMSSKLPGALKVCILLMSAAMVAVIFLPIWKIQLTAPQYPEGLVLKIYANRIGGDVDVVNGLNHYIGMHMLHTRDFVEFQVIPWIIGVFAGLGLVVLLINRRAAFYGWAVLFVLIAFTSMIDFYRWEYNYGHNLNPDAPIQVPGMSYQPPLLGYKQLLNFGAYSIPDSGGWIFVAVGVAMAALVGWDLRGLSKSRRMQGVFAGLLMSSFCLALPGCRSGPEPIQYGSDMCSFCKMGFTDKRFGGEVCTSKGRVYKFDDVHCLLSSLKTGVPARGDVAGIYLVEFSGGDWVKAEDAVLLRSPALHSPMGGDIAAFADRKGGEEVLKQYQGKICAWKELYP